MAVPLHRRVIRRIIRGTLSPFLRWDRLTQAEAGYSMILGVPWDLRHMLPVNLQFVSKCDLTGLHTLFVVFDRTRRPGAEELMAQMRREYPELPIQYLFHPRAAGAIVERVNVSTYFNSLNCVTALKECRTQYAVLHDFDLYPLDPRYFREVVRCLEERQLHFSGLEYTHFDGLSDADRLIGTWCLAMDVQWIRDNFRPIHCFQRIASLGGRMIQLDPFSYLQTLTPKRALVGTLDGQACCHVKNLCGTYIRYKTGRNPDFVWRLHYLWYLESLCGQENRLNEVTQAMRLAGSGLLRVGAFQVDFSRTHVTCADVLDKELGRMEAALFGAVRSEVVAYLSAFHAFLYRYGDSGPLPQRT